MAEIIAGFQPHEIKNKAIKGASINIVARFVATLGQTVGVVILARLLTPSDFGLVAMVAAFSLWLSNFGVNGFTEYIIYKSRIDTEEVTSIYWTHLLVSTVLAIGFALFGFALVKLNREPALSGIAAALATTFVLQALSTSHLAVLRREMKFTAVAIAELLAVILSVVLAIAGALAGMGYWAIVVRQVTVPLAMVIAARILHPWRPRGPLRLSSAWPGLKYAVQVYSNISLGFLMRGLDKVLLGKFHGAELLGNYDRAFYIFLMPAVQLLTPLHNVALSALSRLAHDKEKFSSSFAKAVSLVTFFGTLAALLVTITAHDLVRLLLGPNWSEAGRVAAVFGPGIAAQPLFGASSWLHLSLGTPQRWLRWNLFAAAATVVAFSIAAPFGAVAMAATYTAMNFILALPSIWYGGRPIQLRLRVVTENLWPHIFSGVVMGLSWMFLGEHWGPMRELMAGFSPFIRILATVGAATVLYIGGVVVLQRSFKSVRDVLALLPHIFSRIKP